jgi:hypothetical protein
LTPASPYEEKARHLRALYREQGEAGVAVVREKFDRLFPEGDARLGQILVNAWIEGRQLQGQTYDTTQQCWRDREGRPVP